MRAFYNDSEPYVAEWLRNLIAAGHITGGTVDQRSIEAIEPGDLDGFSRCHFFAGIAGWEYALRLAGWPDTRAVWTASLPCQPFSVAGARKGGEDERHLWPVFYRLVRECRPSTIFGEQVEAAIGHGWLDRVFADLETEGYACGAIALPACSVGAPHIRQRIFWLAHASIERRQQESRGASGNEAANGRQSDANHVTAGHGEDGGVAVAISERRDIDCRQARRGESSSTRRSAFSRMADSAVGGQRIDGSTPRNTGHTDEREQAGSLEHAAGEQAGIPGQSRQPGGTSGMGNPDDKGLSQRERDRRIQRETMGTPEGEAAKRSSDAGFWGNSDLIPCADGKARRVESGTFPLAHGIPARVGKLRAYGNAIVPALAAEFIKAFMECE